MQVLRGNIDGIGNDIVLDLRVFDFFLIRIEFYGFPAKFKYILSFDLMSYNRFKYSAECRSYNAPRMF